MASAGKDRLSSYSVVKAIGKGSYGEVFLVRHSRERKQFVMKNIKLTAASAKERLAAEQEASLLSQLQHPNIVSYKESFQDQQGVLHIVMGYCEGGDLCSRLKTFQGQLLPEVQVVEWFVQIALALQYLHERNILHRDLKTQNIFLSKNNIIKVGDLGIARVLDGSCDLAHTVIGTPYYMGPELFANKPYNHKSDIWALGCCVYEMATLRHAFTARNINALMYKILQGKVPPLPSQFSKDLSDLVHAMLASNMKDRPSVHQILRMDFVRRHIRMFLDRAASKRRKGSQKAPSTAGEPSSGGGDEGVTGRKEVPPELARRRNSSDGKEGSDVTDSKPAKPSASIDKRRSTSLTSLPQAKASPRLQQQKPAHKHNSAKKPPRPLPPDPVVVESGRTHENHKVEGKPPPSPSTAIISARERRRRQKQQDRGRVVLRSRSSSDLQQRRGSTGSSGEGESPLLPPRGGERGGEKEEVDCCEPDGLVQVPKQSLPQLGGEPTKIQDLMVNGGMENCSQGGGGGGGERQQEREEREEGEERGGGGGKGGEGEEEEREGGRKGGGSRDSQDEIDEFYTLLDTTLHLPEPPSVREEREAPLPRVAFCEPEGEGAETSSTTTPLPSGRLRDRIVALRHECLYGLGKVLMDKVFQMLDHLEPEEAEEELLAALGRDKFDSYAAKLQQLKLCEDSLYGF